LRIGCSATLWRAVVPSRIELDKTYPLVVVLHGLRHNGRDIERYYQFDRFVESRELLLAYPNGTREGLHKRTTWASFLGRFWNATDVCCDFAESHVDDVAYLDAVIDDMSATYRVDPKRIFVAGLSSGAYMAYRYACDRADRVAAIVSHAGAMWTDLNQCRPAHPVAVLHIHGTADEMVPYAGGRTVGGTGPLVVSAHQSVSDWVAFDKCASSPEVFSLSKDLVRGESLRDAPKTTVEKWIGCRGVELWTIHGATHSPSLNYPAWPMALLDWLLAHPKP
jgi:polyhydroxybutyrate depolymerase